MENLNMNKENYKKDWFEQDMNEWYNKEYYVLQWYDESYAGCWRDKNRYETLEEARDFISRWLNNHHYRIVKKSEEVIEYHKLNEKKNK